MDNEATLDTGLGQVVADQPQVIRNRFIRNTYIHVVLAILLFAGIESALLQTTLPVVFLEFLSQSKWMWLGALGVFFIGSMVATSWARNAVSAKVQYLGLLLYTVLEALIFLPVIFIANAFMPGVLIEAAIATLSLVAGLTLVAFTTKKDFSFIKSFLTVGAIIAVGLIVTSIAFGYSLGLWFTGGMIVFAAGSVLYSTSKIIHEYRPDQHVAAALSLFASIALLFWYILRLFMSLASSD
jgi:FtsH-binding integral membrane protein